MAITKIKNSVSDLHVYIKIEFTCPVCKSKKVLQVPKSVINQAKQLSTISIARGLVCIHQFQAFVDKNFKVRGYQKVDFEFEMTEDTKNNLASFNNSDENLFENLIIEENFLEYRPKKLKKHVSTNQKHKKMTLKEIYEDFWEFIDDDNKEFSEFIINDDRRKK